MTKMEGTAKRPKKNEKKIEDEERESGRAKKQEGEFTLHIA